MSGVFVRLSDTEWGAIVQALAVEHPVRERRPNPAEWVRDLAVAHASQVLGVEVTRAGLPRTHGGVPDWKRRRGACAALPLAGDGARASDRAIGTGRAQVGELGRVGAVLHDADALPIAVPMMCSCCARCCG